MSLSNAREVERLFRRLHRETAAQYEEELERATDEAEKGKRQQRLQFERLRPLLRSAQSKRPDRKLIKRLEVTQRKELQEFLKMARSQLRKRATRATEVVKDLAHHPMMQISGLSVVPVYAATLLSADPEDLEGNPGKKGNPWILPDNPNTVFVKKTSMGGKFGSGCEAQPYVPPTKAVFWYGFYPPKAGIWNLQAQVYLSGYCVIKTDFWDNLIPGWWNPFQATAFCVESDASVNATMNVYRAYSGWLGARQFDLFSHWSKTDNTTQLVNPDCQFDYLQTWLPASTLTLIKVEISLDTHARGFGYYSELNFAGGPNQIIPLYLIAWNP